MRRDFVPRIVAADVRRRTREIQKPPPPRVGGYGLVLLPSLLTGCSRAPTFDIVGSFFPAWLVCLFLGILLTVFARWLLLRLKVAIVLPILVYPSLTALFTFLLWLIFFS